MGPTTLEPFGTEPDKHASNSTRVLIADDHRPILERVTALLRPHFNVVGTATNGNMLVEQSIHLEPDIVVSDILMPGCSGLEAARLLRENGSTAKIVFLSVYGRTEFVKAALEHGGLAYVTKARLNTDLVVAINEVLSGRQFVSPSIQYV